jgi:hypothetical protein
MGTPHSTPVLSRCKRYLCVARYVRCVLHRRTLHRCALHAASATCSPPAAHRRAMCRMVCCAFARLDWAKGGLCGDRAAVRCTRAQSSGGVLFMVKGTALFDTVAISDTEAAGRFAYLGNDWLNSGGMVRLSDGKVTLKGVNISNSRAVLRVRCVRTSDGACCKCSCFTLHVVLHAAHHVLRACRACKVV